jgi:hypothetical protein
MLHLLTLEAPTSNSLDQQVLDCNYERPRSVMKHLVLVQTPTLTQDSTSTYERPRSASKHLVFVQTPTLTQDSTPNYEHPRSASKHLEYVLMLTTTQGLMSMFKRLVLGLM